MYLEHDDWSPRYQDTFYTVRLEHFERLTSPPPVADAHIPPNHIGGKTSLPAYYYKLEVFCGRHPPKTVFRRYSQFKWLYENLPNETLSFPLAGIGCTFCSPQTHNFANNRKGDLKDFLEEALTRREIASHEIVARFLELDAFVAAAATTSN
jgi:hypothetical protein